MSRRASESQPRGVLILKREPHGAERHYLSCGVRRTDVTGRRTVPSSPKGGGRGESMTTVL